MPITHIALVGHCGFDAGTLMRLAQHAAPQAVVSNINDQQALNALAKPGSLLLVNRVLDGRFSVGGSGIDLIRSLACKPDAPKLMLISNYADAQQEAIDAGALPGFGKSQAGDPATRQRLADAIAEL